MKAVFEISPRGLGHHTMVFRWDSLEGEVSPQSDILLQILCDAVERALVRLHPVGEANTELAPTSVVADAAAATLRLASQE